MTVTATAESYLSGSLPVLVGSGAPTTAPEVQLVKQRFGRITGTVTDGSDPLPGATVRVNRVASCEAIGTPRCPVSPASMEASPSVRSCWEFANANVNAVVTASATDYWPRSKTLPVEADTTTDFGEFDLVKICTAAIEGTVRNAVTQDPIDGATVRVPGAPSATTIDGGKYRVEGIVLGADNAERTVPVTASAINYFPVTINARLTQANCAEGAAAIVEFGTQPVVSSCIAVVGSG